MNCDECKQQPATVHLTKILNNEKTELHLCEDCARQHPELPFNFNFSLEPNLSIQKLLAGLLGGSKSPDPEDPEEGTAENSLKCPNCSLTYKHFGQLGRFGCSQCYQAFSPQIEPLLRRVQGNSRHTGKMPQRAAGLLGFRRELENLKEELQDAISSEAYERAAALRDRIRALEGVQ